MMHPIFSYRKKALWGYEDWYVATRPGLPLPPNFQLPDPSESSAYEMPFFVKRITANEPLSVQVHPQIKDEFWVISDAAPDAEIILGTKTPVDTDQLRRHLTAGTVMPLLRRVTVRAGDCFFVPSGVIHAIGAGITLYEIQPTVDVTYRLFDYNRRMPDGTARSLHIDAALACLTKQTAAEQRILSPSQGTYPLLRSRWFTVRYIKQQPQITVRPGDQLLCIGGNGAAIFSDSGQPVLSLAPGTCLQAADAEALLVTGDASLLLISSPS